MTLIERLEALRAEFVGLRSIASTPTLIAGMDEYLATIDLAIAALSSASATEATSDLMETMQILGRALAGDQDEATLHVGDVPQMARDVVAMLAAAPAPVAPVAQEAVDPGSLDVRLTCMTESNGRETWGVMLARSTESPALDCLQVYSDEIKGRAEYERDRFRHFLGQGPEPDILSYDTAAPVSSPMEEKTSSGNPLLWNVVCMCQASDPGSPEWRAQWRDLLAAIEQHLQRVKYPGQSTEPPMNGGAMQMTYAAVAYRWGYLNEHHYFIYVGPDRAKAIALAQAENADRGGKYGCVVWEFRDTEEGEQDQENVAYFKSFGGEEKPSHNHRIDMFERLGHKFYEFAEGVVYLPVDHEELKNKDGTPMRVMKPNKIEPPQWVIDEAKRAQALCDAMSSLEPQRGPVK